MSVTTIKLPIEFPVDENGKVYSQYAKRFDENSRAWTKDPVYNQMFLKTQEAYADDLLRAKGYLFLNEVYDMLGIPRTKTGQCVGWAFENSDKHVTFGLNEVIDFSKVMIEPNVDGIILDKLPD